MNKERRAGLQEPSVRALLRLFILWAVAAGGCGSDVDRLLPESAESSIDHERYELVARFAHISDAQIVDEESPGRLVSLSSFSRSAWRPYEAYSTQLLDGTIRAINKVHAAREKIDFVIHSGDATDNVQENELTWFITLFDGGWVDPRSGPDDRDPALLPDPFLDPHQPFEAQGLYRQGTHGDAPTIGWYSVAGNHDHFAVGVLPIVRNLAGNRTAPMPFQPRLGLFLPIELNPMGDLSWAPISPAHMGPPQELRFPAAVPANLGRRYLTDREWVHGHLTSTSEPPGHGFSEEFPDRTWYSVAPKSGLRLIVLNSSTPFLEQPGYLFPEGAISIEQKDFLRRELDLARSNDECVILATHHPSGSLEPIYGTSLWPDTLRQMLNEAGCVALHLAGHLHINPVLDRGRYVEMVTGSTLDAPQRGRIVEIWRRKDAPAPDEAGENVGQEPFDIRYRFFSHLDSIDPLDESQTKLFEDPLYPMRRVAADLAGVEE